MSVFPAQTYKKGHRHGPGRAIVIPGGEGYSILWPHETAEKIVIPWHEASLFTPPGRWFHQHFNLGEGPGRYLALHPLPQDAAWVWVAGLLAYDFCYYWHHRLGHTVAVLWAAHAVHHQSEEYNLSTALRQTSTGWLFGWIFYLPMAVAGFPPLVFGVVALVDLLYQYWVHTQQIGKLGWFDRWFCAPSNHRVHHAVNDKYLDKNYGGILIVWDRLFRTFEPEGERVRYGLTTNIKTFNPARVAFHEYAVLLRDVHRARGWRLRMSILLRGPGWAAEPES